MPKKKGRDIGFYVASGSAPSDLADASEYTSVGNLTEQSYERSRNMIDVSDADSGDDSDFLPGRRSRTITLEGYYQPDEQAGQEILHDSLEADDDKLYWIISSSTTGDKEIHGRAYVSAINFSAPDEGAATFSATLQVVGKPAESVIT